MKYLFSATLLLVFAQLAVAQQPATLQHINGRKLLSLNGSWNYIVDPYEMGYYDYRHEPFEDSPSGKGGFYDDRIAADKSELVEYNFDLAPTLDVPGDWNSQAENLSLYEGTIWYRRKFDVHPQAGQRYILYFGAVNYEAHVYLNGKKLGMHKGGFTPFQFDVTDKLVKGTNSIVVKADNSRHRDEIPTVNTDWWNYGGITRDVYLAEVPAIYIADYKIQLTKANGDRLGGFVQLDDSTAGQRISIRIPEAGMEWTLQTDGTGKATFEADARKLTRWTPEHPKLYDVELVAYTDTVNDRIGFRTIETRGYDILLNGRSVFLRGISLHDENPLIPGRLRGEGDMRMMLQWAKNLHCNYVRLAHYPHNEQMLRLADEMGLMVWAEVPVYWTISWENTGTYQNAERQLTDLILRDKNRASVIVWSVGNETPLSAARYQFMSKLATTARALDDTRLVSAALEVHREGKTIIVNDSLGQHFDLVSFNEYAGWYWGGNPEAVSTYRFDITYDKPVVITEFGGDALLGYHGDENTRWSEEYQAALYVHQLRLLRTIPGLRGMTPWVLADFRSPRRQHPYFQNFWNRKGLYSSTGQKKQAFFILQSFYDEIKQQYDDQ